MTDSTVMFSILGSLFLLCMSGLYSGLTLGLCGLEPLSLQIVAEGDTHNAQYAKKIIPVRAKGNLLLCTLLLGNVAVNAALAILLANFTGGLLGFFLSTGFIVIFGEILPQAACSRYALYIGSKVIYIVRVLILLIYPLSWPISKVLDWALGDELGMIYTNRELVNLVEVHTTQGELNTESAGIMQGALDFSKLQVGRVMTDWKEVFFIYSDINLDFVALERIFKSGHSRVPVVNRATKFEGEEVIGLLFVKDLILLDPEDEIPVQNIVDTFCHDLKYVDLTMSVKSVMDEFRHGRSHLAVVRKQGSKKPNCDFITYENVGIVTLEDIIENILRMDIEDEFDSAAVTAEDKTRKNEIVHLFDYRRTRGMDGMPPQEKIVVYRHLCKEVKVFMPKHRKAEEVDLQNLLAAGSVYKAVSDNWQDTKKYNSSKQNIMVEDGGFLLYLQGVQSEFFTFILDGKVEIFSGRQRFRSEVSRFTILCPELLFRMQNDFVEDREFSVFVPDFTARVIQNSRVLRISRENFNKCLLGKLRNYSRPFKETKEKFREISQRSLYNVRKQGSETTFSQQLSNYELRKTETERNLRKKIEQNGGVSSANHLFEDHKLDSEEKFKDAESIGCVIVRDLNTQNNSHAQAIELLQKTRVSDL